MENNDGKKKKPLRLRDRLGKSDVPKPKKQPAPSNAFLWVEEHQYKVLEVNYGFKRHADGSGRAVGDVHLQPFIVVLKPLGTMDDLVELAWLSTMMFSGRIENYHDDGIHKKHKDTIIHNAFIESYDTFGNYYEEQQGRVIVLKIAPQYVKVMESDFETSMNPSQPMEMNPTGLLSRESFEEEPNVMGYHIEDKDGNRIEQGKIKANTIIVVVINSTNAIGETAEIDLHNNKVDYKYNGTLLEDDILEVRITQDLMRVTLQTVEEQQKQ